MGKAQKRLPILFFPGSLNNWAVLSCKAKEVGAWVGEAVGFGTVCLETIPEARFGVFSPGNQIHFSGYVKVSWP